MADISVQQVVVDGLIDPTFSSAAGGGDSFNNNGATIFLIDNGGGGSITATFDDVNSVGLAGANQFDPDVDVVVDAGERAYCGPFSTVRFGTSVAVTYTGVSSVTVAALRV